MPPKYNIKKSTSHSQAHSNKESISIKIRKIWEKVDENRNLDKTFDAKEYKQLLSLLESYMLLKKLLLTWELMNE